MSMKKRLMVLFGICFVGASAWAQIPAFPGAEGYGAYATGGRGGDVYHVTTTEINNTDPGSFYYGITTVPAGGRTIVFDVSGYIRIPSGSGWNFSADNVTIAGQTAPGDGIGFYNASLNITGDDIVLRHLRFRRGHTDASGDCLDIGANSRTMLDHLSVGFSTDENISSFNSAPTDLTFQYSINGWGLEGHSAGGLWDQNTATTHHTFWPYNHTRNPKARPVMLEWINNVTFGYDIGFIMGDSQTSYDWRSNLIGNYWIGPPGNTHLTTLTSGLIADNGRPNFSIYLEDNLIDVDGDGILNGVDRGYDIAQGTGYAPGTGGLTPGAYGYYASPTAMAGSPAGVVNDSPLLAYKKVVSNAGALRLDSSFAGGLRDQVDVITFDYLEHQVNVWNDSYGKTGIEDPGEIGGLGTLSSTTAPTDTDQDGASDRYENAVGWDADADDHNTVFSGAELAGGSTFFPTTTPAGYTYLEEYLHFMASPHTYVDENGYVDIDLAHYTSGFNAPSILFVISNVEGGTVSTQNGSGAVLGDGHTVRFTPAPGTTGRAWFDFTVTDGDGESWTQRFMLIVAEVQGVVPAVPTGLSATASAASRIDLSWSPVSGADSYLVKRATVPGGPYAIIAADLAGTSYSDNELAADSTYYYVVRAVDGGIESADSSEVSASTLLPYLQPADGDGTVCIEAEHFDGKTAPGNHLWETVSGSYSGGEAMQATPNDGTYYSDGYVTACPRMDYQINFTHTGTHYVWLRGVGATTSDDSVHFGFDGAAVTTGVRVGDFGTSPGWLNTSINGVAVIDVASTGTHTLNIWMREDGFVLDKVLVTANSGFTPTSTGPAETVRDTASASSTVPAAPADPVAKGLSENEILLWWTASDGAESYTVKRSATSGGGYVTVAFGLSDRVFSDTNLTASATFYYVVSAVNTNGTSGNSVEVYATTLGAPPAAPTGLSATPAITEPRIDLSWTASSGAERYNVYRSTMSGGPYSLLASGVSSTTYSDNGVISETDYYYVVSALNNNGEGDYSDEAHAAPPPFVAIPIAVTHSVNGIGGEDATGAGSGTPTFTTATFDMNGGNAVAFLVTCEGAGSSSTRDATFAGQAMDKIDVTEGIQSATIFYLVDPAVTSGTFSYYIDSGVITDYAYSQIALSNVVGVADTASNHSATDSAEPLTVSYTTSTDSGFVLGAAANNDYSYVSTRLLSVVGNPDQYMLTHTVVDTFASLHAYGEVAAAGSYIDNYYTQYARTVVATVAFNALSEAVVYPDVTLSFDGAVLSLAWPSNNTGWVLQSSTNLLDGQWMDVEGSSSGSALEINADNLFPVEFFRLRHSE